MTELIQIPALRDNYIYMVIGPENRAFVVDPSEAGPVLAALKARPSVTLEAVLNTHHHFDHVGGNLEIHEETGCHIVGPAHDAARIPGITHPVEIGEEVPVAGLMLRVLDVHAHTRGHVAFAIDTPIQKVVRHGHHGEPAEAKHLHGRPLLFVGDSLFAAGCGRLFEGNPAELHDAMKTLASEDPRALIACGHEYTAANLCFAKDAFPQRSAIAQRLDNLDNEKGSAQSSVPSTLEEELLTNPFILALQTNTHQEVAKRYGETCTDAVSALRILRREKDSF